MMKQNDTDFTNSQQVKIYDRMLHETLLKEIILEIEKKIMPSINEKIKELATTSVSHWTQNIKMQQSHSHNGYDTKTEISIAFVEQVVNKVIHENPTIIKVENKTM